MKVKILIYCLFFFLIFSWKSQISCQVPASGKGTAKRDFSVGNFKFRWEIPEKNDGEATFGIVLSVKHPFTTVHKISCAKTDEENIDSIKDTAFYDYQQIDDYNLYFNKPRRNESASTKLKTITRIYGIEINRVAIFNAEDESVALIITKTKPGFLAYKYKLWQAPK